MKKATFFSVLISNIRCALCKKKKCPVRYMPNRKRAQYIDGNRYVTSCEKDRAAREKAILKRKLP